MPYFVELRMFFFSGVLLLSSMNSYILPTIAISVAAASFILLCVLVFQLYNLTHD
ncbi:hypothetical protein [Serratia sp. 201]|uniref:hypothetical protein n=1 Tax=Serratia sp. 201 TaxID=3096764 RepID=UPI003FA69E12